MILASQSECRAALLRQAGVVFETVSAAVDEAAIKAGMQAEGASARDICDALAEFKARRGSARAPGRLVLGADQILVCEGRNFDKPRDLAEAREQLVFLRGKTHELLSAAVFYEAGEPVWRHIGRAQMMMRPFSDAFLDHYIETQGAGLLSTVGCYKLEEGGSQLFTRVQGDYFSVLGLPLLEVLGFLRSRGLCQE